MKVNFHSRFNKSYKKCSIKIQAQFKKRLKLFLDNPYHPLLENHALHGEWRDFRSINVTGNYRALYHYLNNDTVEFFVIDTHSNLYE
ncbi:MAG: type II toxin-antitoxin system mRNA interferase toxin, RelE/StbE family [Candidatus Brennerbacteria bacterium]|nr:type II toxin-antitoxin system mRNA interferase toxin, RelE/StbE family [Candidatus Brennerbacteria bacterium]